MSFQGFPPVLGSNHIPFQAPAVVNKKVYIPLALEALFHYANILVKAHTLFFTQIFIVLWKIVQVWAVWRKFVPRVGRNSSVALNFFLVFHTPVISHKVCNYLPVTARQTVQLHSVLFQTLGPPWVFLFEGCQIYQPWVSPCLSMETSLEGKQTHCLPCPLPWKSSSLLRTWYVRVEAVFCLVQREGETELLFKPGFNSCLT